METSNDYEEETQESPDGFQYGRPVYLYSSRNTVKEPKNVKKVHKSGSRPISRPRSKRLSPPPLLLVPESTETPQTPLNNSKRRKKAHNSDRYYEYGERMSGYRFVGTQKEFLEFKSSEKCQDQDSSQPVGPATFDRQKAPNKARSTTSEYITRYWSQDRDHTAQDLPLLGDSARTEDITRARVEQFYLRSCSQMGFDLAAVLKGERLRWHPDRLIGKLAPDDEPALKKVTRLFQIINDLWESQQCT